MNQVDPIFKKVGKVIQIIKKKFKLVRFLKHW